MRLYTEAAICRTLGVTQSQLRAWVRSGAIQQGITSGGLFRLEETAREIIAACQKQGTKEETLDYATERAKLMRAKRQEQELELGVKRGQLHRTEDIEYILTKTVVRFKSKIRAIPNRAAPQAAQMNKSAEIFDLLKKLTDEALEELSDFDDWINEHEQQ
jgi:phage terminase Nu1 subunit (DNA packaging protein)